jgi:hypothetical protein
VNGGNTDARTDWIDMRASDGTDWLAVYQAIGLVSFGTSAWRVQISFLL